MSKSRIRSDPEFIGRAPPKSSVRSGHIGARVPTQYFIVLNSTKTPACDEKGQRRQHKDRRSENKGVKIQWFPVFSVCIDCAFITKL